MLAEVFPDPPLQPGMEGWWQVWGAQARHVRVGDRLVFLDDEAPQGLLVQEVAEILPSNLVQFRYKTTEGEAQHFGLLWRGWRLFRRGTHHTLA